MSEPISRDEAINRGLARYFNGQACRNGHVCDRYVNGGCVECKSIIEQSRKSLKKINNAKWRAANREKAIVASALWRAANPDRAKKLVLAWHAENKNKRREHKQNRRSRIKGNGGSLSAGIVEKLYRLQRGKCACCGAPLGEDYHLDHIVPLAKGGPNTDENMQLLTQRCNNQKKDKDPIIFMQQRGFLI